MMARVTRMAQARVVMALVPWSWVIGMARMVGVAWAGVTLVAWSWVAGVARVPHWAAGERLGHGAGLVSTAALHAACVEDLPQLLSVEVVGVGEAGSTDSTV